MGIQNQKLGKAVAALYEFFYSIFCVFVFEKEY